MASVHGNTRPISREVLQPSNNRGRVYRCLRCDGSAKYEGEKSKVVKHIYRKHVALDRVPFYCNICKFVTTTQAELEKHMNITVYPTHAATVNAMLSSGQVVSENNSLLQNTVFHVPGDSDIIRLSRDESSAIFKGRQQMKSWADTSSTNDILRTVMMSAKIPVIEKSLQTPSVATENILPELLGHTTLSPAPEMMNNIHVPVQADTWAPMKKQTSEVGKSDSSSSSSSSSASSESSSSMKRERKLEKEVGELREATRTMATAMEGLIEEIKWYAGREITAMREERREEERQFGRQEERGERE